MRLRHDSMHISCYQDTKDILGYLGHEVEGLCLSRHAWVLGYEQQSYSIPVNLSLACNPDHQEEFYKSYAGEMKHYDAVFITYAPCLAPLYERFELPIIMHIPIRYEYPWTGDKEGWSRFNEWIRRASKSGQLHCVANNRYDAWWLTANTGVPCEVISSLCEYPGIQWAGKNKDWWLVSRKLPSTLKMPDNTIDIKNLGKYTYQDLLGYRGIIHVPYQVSTMSMFEQYWANFPLFVPSVGFLRQLHREGNAMQEVCWRRRDQPDWKEVSRGADYYSEFSYVVQYNSINHLNSLFRTVNVEEVSYKMQLKNKYRKQRVLDQWRAILAKL